MKTAKSWGVEVPYYILTDEGNEPILSPQRNILVSVVGKTGSLVEVECGDGYTYFAYPEELVPNDCCGNNPVPDLFHGDRVLALATTHGVRNAHHYYVDDIARNGLIRVSRFNPTTNTYDQVKGWFDPSCFRLDPGE